MDKFIFDTRDDFTGFVEKLVIFGGVNSVHKQKKYLSKIIEVP